MREPDYFPSWQYGLFPTIHQGGTRGGRASANQRAAGRANNAWLAVQGVRYGVQVLGKGPLVASRIDSWRIWEYSYTTTEFKSRASG